METKAVDGVASGGNRRAWLWMAALSFAGVAMCSSGNSLEAMAKSELQAWISKDTLFCDQSSTNLRIAESILGEVPAKPFTDSGEKVLPAIVARGEYTCVSKYAGQTTTDSIWIIFAYDKHYKMLRCYGIGDKSARIDPMIEHCQFKPD